ncbi:MAG: hypothetical protein NTY46_10365 [Candidatus Sumerlaeota bacterium]|nr:hypothetical protein [Candidatus Sumerlaeota bacterium]
MTTSLINRIMELALTPTAPFREHWFCAAVDRQLAAIPGVRFEADAFGNRIARLRRGAPHGALPVFVAHMDHPGFIFPPQGARAISAAEPNRYEAVFEGRVDDEYFPGAPVALYRAADDKGVAGQVVSAAPRGGEDDNRRVVIETRDNAEGAVLAAWDVPVFMAEGGLILARACDDVAGCGMLIEAMARLAGEPDIDIALILTRAEEAGLCGTLCMLDNLPIPGLDGENAIFISVETSSERPGIALGEGAVIRIGDRSSTFDGAFADELWGLARMQSLFARRALMDGGTCEATLFGRAGLRCGGICVPVRNYHNMDREAGSLAPEIIAETDTEALVELVAGIALAHARGDAASAPPLVNWNKLLRKGQRQLQPLRIIGR